MASIPDGTDGTNIYGKRYYALSFGIGQYGYLGTGYNDNYQRISGSSTRRWEIKENGQP